MVICTVAWKPDQWLQLFLINAKKNAASISLTFILVAIKDNQRQRDSGIFSETKNEYPYFNFNPYYKDNGQKTSHSSHTLYIDEQWIFIEQRTVGCGRRRSGDKCRSRYDHDSSANNGQAYLCGSLDTE